MPSLILRMLSCREKLPIKIVGVKTWFLQLAFMGIEKSFFSGVLPPPPGTKKILLHTVVVLHLRHHIKMEGLVLGGGRLSKCSKTLYNSSTSNQVTSIILLTTAACLYTYFYLTEHDLVF